MFLAYGTEHGSALIDAALYLPRTWTEDLPRRQKAGVPDDVTYRSRAELGVELLRRARAAGCLRAGWVTARPDEGLEPELRALLHADGWRYVLPVRAATAVLDSPGGQPTSVLELAEPWVSGDPSGDDAADVLVRRVWELDDEAPSSAAWFVARRTRGGEVVCYLSNAPEDTAPETLRRIVTSSWPNGATLEGSLAEAGMAVYRVRGWDGWHRHATLTLLANALRACSSATLDLLPTPADTTERESAAAPPPSPSPEPPRVPRAEDAELAGPGNTALAGGGLADETPAISERAILATTATSQDVLGTDEIADRAATPSGEEQVVILDVGGEAYGVEVPRVQEIVRVPPITVVPNGPPFLEGVINLRGQVIPVVDLRTHLGLAATTLTRRSRVVVAELGAHRVGLIVDGVTRVVVLAAGAIQPPPSLAAAGYATSVRGVTQLGEGLVLLLDTDRILAA